MPTTRTGTPRAATDDFSHDARTTDRWQAAPIHLGLSAVIAAAVFSAMFAALVSAIPISRFGWADAAGGLLLISST